MKLRPYVYALLLAVLPGWAPTFATDPPVESFAPLSSADAEVPVLPPGSALTATELEAAPRCHPSKRRATLVPLRWQPAATPDGVVADQRVELTKFREGFRTGRLEASRRLAADIGAVTVDSPEVGIVYYWRVLTLGDQGWTSSAVRRFEVPVCPYDEPDLSRFEGLSTDDRPSSGSSQR